VTVVNRDNPQQPGSETASSKEESARIDFSSSWRAPAVRPPQKPFAARRARASNPFFMSTQSGEKEMSDKFTQDRMAAFTPQMSKRVADIPNLASLRSSEADLDGKRLFIGKQIRMKGEISGCERLVIEGHVEASLSDVKSIEVTSNGSLKGSAEVESAVIAGTYEGNLKVRGHLEIAASGVVKGDVAYKTVAVANGGKLLGSIATLDN
jgi:cytoskeletal protein CcmA (bactofilin family)